jgi:hypothetical protein
MSDWVRLLAGIPIGLCGLLILARLDIPHIEHGGWSGVLATADLLFFTLLLAAAFAACGLISGGDRPE